MHRVPIKVISRTKIPRTEPTLRTTIGRYWRVCENIFA